MSRLTSHGRMTHWCRLVGGCHIRFLCHHFLINPIITSEPVNFPTLCLAQMYLKILAFFVYVRLSDKGVTTTTTVYFCLFSSVRYFVTLHTSIIRDQSSILTRCFCSTVVYSTIRLVSRDPLAAWSASNRDCQVTSIAQEAFVDVGEALQRRRHLDFISTFRSSQVMDYRFVFLFLSTVLSSA